MEHFATRICTAQTVHLPGLFQTEDHARAIFEVAQLVSERLALPMAEVPSRKGIFRVVSIIAPPRRRKRDEFDGFYAQDGRIEHLHRQIFKEDRGRMMRLFQHVQQRNLTIGPELRQLVRRRLKYVDNTFRYAKAHREVFADLLRHKGQVGSILRAMHRVDFLGKWLPGQGFVLRSPSFEPEETAGHPGSFHHSASPGSESPGSAACPSVPPHRVSRQR